MTNQREIRYAQAQNEAIRLSMRRDPNVIVMGEDIAAAREGPTSASSTRGAAPSALPRASSKSSGPSASAIHRCRRARSSARPSARPRWAEAHRRAHVIDFLGVCLDQILNNGAKLRYMLGGQVSVPVTILTRIGAGTGSAAQHSESFYSVIAHIPGLKCVGPRTHTRQRPPCRGHPGRRPGHRLRPQAAPEQHRPGPGRRVHPAPGQGPDPAPRTRRNPRRHLAHDVPCAWKPPRSWRSRASTQRSSTCSACRPWTRRRAELGGEDGPHRHRGRGHPALQRCHGHRPPWRGPGLRSSRRPAQDRDRPATLPCPTAGRWRAYTFPTWTGWWPRSPRSGQMPSARVAGSLGRHGMLRRRKYAFPCSCGRIHLAPPVGASRLGPQMKRRASNHV